MYSDVVVVGAGNAALCAAIAARLGGANVLVLEKAPRESRGGNSALTLNMRFAYNALEDIEVLTPLPPLIREALTEVCPHYPASAYYAEMLEVTGGRCDPAITARLVEQSWPTICWLTEIGHEWVATTRPHAGCIPLDMKGGGHGLQSRSFEIASRLGIRFEYDAAATELSRNADLWTVGTVTRGSSRRLEASAVILACGGFEANRRMRADFLGPLWQDVKIRGVPFNTGDGLKMALSVGATPHGSWDSCHASPQDSRLPSATLPEHYSSSRSYWRYSFPYGITVNKDGTRFFDEGETYSSLTYAKVGKRILEQRDSVAFQLFDARASELGLINVACYAHASVYTAESLCELAALAGIDKGTFVRTVRRFNNSIPSGQPFDSHTLDGRQTVGLEIPKSNWALPIDQPPYVMYPVICGLTFTFGGIRVNTDAGALDASGRPIPGLFAAGEMIGGLFYDNYPGGAGMMAGAVFGRSAGMSAAAYVMRRS